MASEYYGINRGQHETDVVSQTSTNSTDLELRIDLTKSLTKAEIIQLVQFIENIIIKNNPARL